MIIYSDNNPAGDPEKFLRYFGIAQLTSTADGASTGWVAATQGTYLPEGIYFNPDASQSSGSTSSGSVSWNKAANTMNLAYPRLTVESSNDGAGQEEYYYYEFDSNGTVSSSFMNNWLVLQAGTLKPGTGGSLSVDFTEAENVNLKTALIFRRAGTTTRVNDPGDID